MRSGLRTSLISSIASLFCICSTIFLNPVYVYAKYQQLNTDFSQKTTTQQPLPMFSTVPDSPFLSPAESDGRAMQAFENVDTVPSRRVFISPIRKRDPEDNWGKHAGDDIAFLDIPTTTSPIHVNSHHPWITSPETSSRSRPTQTKFEESTLLFITHPIAAVLICILVLVLIVSTVLGNCMVCLAVLMVRKLKQQPANLLLVSLAVADCCVGLLVMPVALVNILEERWILGEVVCRLWTSADLTLCTASILNLCVISVDRYLAVTRALRYAVQRTRRRMFGYIAIVWIGALLVSVAPLILLPLKDVVVHDHSCQVSQNQLYQIYATIISFYGPCLIMVVVYVQMWRAAKRLQKKDKLTMKWSLGLAPVSESPNSSFDRSESPTKKPSKFPKIGKKNLKTVAAVIQSPLKRFQRPSALLNAVRMPLLHSRPHHEKGEDKARKTLGVIMSVFIICWVPFFILALVKSQYVIHVPKWLDMLVLWLGYSNSMLNPLIYCKYNREFRVPFKEMLCCRFGTIQTVMRNESFHHRFGAPRLAPDFKFSKAGKSNSNGTIRTGAPRKKQQRSE